MNISLTPQLEKLVSAKVKSGLYGSASEVMREALRLLEDRDRLRGMRREELRAEIQKGLDSGPATPMNFKAFRKKTHKWLAEMEKEKRGGEKHKTTRH